MMAELGVYWSVMHRRPQDYAFFEALQPSVIKIMDGGPPDYAWVRQHLPHTLILARDWALSEQHEDMLKDPTGTGIRHANEWWQHSERLGFDRAQTLVLGINEPRVWEPGVPQALREYTIALCNRGAQLGLRVGAMQLSVGWPNNNGSDTPPNWSLWDGVDTAIRACHGALICHEYWADSGPAENWGWWAGRSLKCPWDVPIVIGECGIDMYVKDASVAHETRGWRGRKSPEAYAAELAEYTGRMNADNRFAGCCVFAADFANREWASFDIEPAYHAILAAPIPDYTPEMPDSKPPVTTHLPAVGTGTDETQEMPTNANWERSIAWVLQREGGFQNNPADIGNYYQGKLIGTKYGISAASWGGQYDIPSLTLEQAKAIYYTHYWQASGADKLPWPASLIAFDTAVLHGVGTAQAWIAEVGVNALAIAAKRLRVYTGMKTWGEFGAGWTNRVADLLLEASKA